jgi:hypothetical protein
LLSRLANRTTTRGYKDVRRQRREYRIRCQQQSSNREEGELTERLVGARRINRRAERVLAGWLRRCQQEPRLSFPLGVGGRIRRGRSRTAADASRSGFLGWIRLGVAMEGSREGAVAPPQGAPAAHGLEFPAKAAPDALTHADGCLADRRVSTAAQPRRTHRAGVAAGVGRRRGGERRKVGSGERRRRWERSRGEREDRRARKG